MFLLCFYYYSIKITQNMIFENVSDFENEQINLKNTLSICTRQKN